jgi:glycerol-3-phosphate dehydrogenase (NAD(P)+)
MNVTLLGAGAWGTALAMLLSASHRVTLWTRNPAHCAVLTSERENRRYLSGFTLPDAIIVTSDLAAALNGCELAVIATTVAGLRPVVRAVAAERQVPVVWLCKGFETGTGKLPHEICAEELPEACPRAVLSGPSFAREVANGLPAAVTLASDDATFAQATARALHCPVFRVYSGTDVIGVEVCGAVKNVMAIAAGVADELHLGLNARAALITRGLAEITRLGMRLGGRAETFMGLSGAGDLILTCTGDLSRNRTVGMRLAQGKSLERIFAALGHAAEGVATAREVDALARRLDIDMPITRAVCDVLYDGVDARTAVKGLLEREPKAEY